MRSEQYIPPEERDNIISDQNVGKMNTEMQKVLAKVAMSTGDLELGGERLSESSIYGYFDGSTGEIKMFEGDKKVPDNIKKYPTFNLAVARTAYSKRIPGDLNPVVDFNLSERGVSSKANSIIKSTVEKYNIGRASNLEELYITLIASKKVGDYNAYDLIGWIKKVKNGELEAEAITRTSGLREKVGKLLNAASEQKKETVDLKEKAKESLVAQNIGKMEEIMEKRIPEDKGELGLGSVNIAGETHGRKVVTAYFDKETGEIINFGRKDQIHKSVTEYPTMNIFAVGNLPEDKGFGKRSFIEKMAYAGKINPDAEKVIKDTVARYNIGNAENFQGLYAILEAMGELKGSEGEVYPADKLIKWISGISSSEAKLDSITRTGGLRDKVEELLDKFSVKK